MLLESADDKLDATEAENGKRKGLNKQLRKNPWRIVVFAIGAIVCIFLAALLAFNLFIQMTYSNFYHKAAKEFETPGLSEGFIPQDLSYIESYDCWIFSGYMDNGSASPVYRRDARGNVSKIYLYLPNSDNEYTGHGGGITSNNDYIFITHESNYMVISLDDVLNAKDGEFVHAIADVQVEFTPAFLNIEGGKLYLGNFYHAGKYDSPEKMHLEAPDKTLNHAVMYEFQPDANESYGFSRTPSAVYSIPDRVQGVCIADNKAIFSTSWGLSASKLPIYSLNDLKQSGVYPYSLTSIAATDKGNADDGVFNRNDVADANKLTEEEEASEKGFIDVPLYFLDSSNLVETIEAPPMSEGIELHDGRVYIENESASNRYIFGKLFDGSMVYSIAL